jgi:hypothetical protein
MRRMRTLLAFTVPIVLGFGACVTDDNHAVSLCTALCDCRAVLPSAHRECLASCAPSVPPSVPAACAACVLEASCAELEDGDCAPLCAVDEPPVPDTMPLSSPAPSLLRHDDLAPAPALEMP